MARFQPVYKKILLLFARTDFEEGCGFVAESLKLIDLAFRIATNGVIVEPRHALVEPAAGFVLMTDLPISHRQKKCITEEVVRF